MRGNPCFESVDRGVFLVGEMRPKQAVPPQECGAQCAGVLCSSRACGVLQRPLGDLFCWGQFLFSLWQKWDLEYSCRQLISEQEVSWSMRLSEFNKCFFRGKQSKLLFKLLLVITFLVLNRPWLCLIHDVALSCYNFINVGLWCFTFW